jgi:hypothetical protein
VVLVHNHPPNVFKTVLTWAADGWTPIASTDDRRIAQHFLQSRIGHLLTSSRPSSLKWYLVDQGRLSPFFLPAPDDLARWLEWAGEILRTPSE